MNNLKLHLNGLKAEIDKKINYHLNVMTPVNLQRLDLDHPTELNFIIKHCQAVKSLQDVLNMISMITPSDPTTCNDPNDSWDPPQW
tara:strand:+ start:866 stop:1123 length:258 start_codon:yes stop_codon:yes gene_type:complete